MDAVVIKKKLFADYIEFIIYDCEEEIILPIIDDAYKEALRLEKIFNFFDKSSELSILNKKRKMKVSPELLEVLKAALNLAELTSGSYDISLGKNILQRKNKQELTKISCSYKNILTNNNLVILNHPDVLIDLGSIAKGYIADKLAAFLYSKGLEEFMIDARGDIRLSGSYAHNLGVQHPRDKDKAIVNLKVSNAGIATSGDYNQFHNSYDNSHILNQKELISVTVIAPSLMLADGYATALFVSPSEIQKKLLNLNKDISALTIGKKLDLKMHNNFNHFIDKT